MQTLQQSIPASYIQRSQNVSLVSRFFNWTASQEKYRYGWLATILAIHGCILAPIVLLIVFLNGANIVLATMVAGSLAACLITNLAAMPTKITIPVFFTSLLVDLAVVAISVATLLG